MEKKKQKPSLFLNLHKTFWWSTFVDEIQVVWNTCFFLNKVVVSYKECWEACKPKPPFLITALSSYAISYICPLILFFMVVATSLSRADGSISGSISSL